MFDKRALFHSRFTFATILLIVVAPSFVISTWSNTLCRGEMNTQIMLTEGIYIDVYTSNGGRGIDQESGAFWPFKEVILYAEFMNTSIPIPDRVVSFLIHGPIDQ